MTKGLFVVLLIVLIESYAGAKVKPVVHYNFGRVGNVTYAATPERIAPIAGKDNLSAVGHPVFYADAPMEKALKGEGAILFNGKDDGYSISKSIGMPDNNILFEVWVKARVQDTKAVRPSQEWVVAANGNRLSGYQIAQQGNHWVLVSGNSGTYVIGEVMKDQWVHLAMTVDGNTGMVWYNGKKTGTFKPTKSFAPSFSIGCDESGKGNFQGEIYEVRYSTFETGKFDSDSDFLLNYKQLAAKESQQTKERKAFVRMIEAPCLGKEIVTNFAEFATPDDWLVTKVESPCRLEVKKSADQVTSQFRITNGLVSRSFFVSDNVACVSYKNISNDAEYLRAVKPEARLCIDSVWYEIGGLDGQPEQSYLLASWYPQLKTKMKSFILQKVETTAPVERYPWKPKYNSINADWPAKGLRVVMTYRPSEYIPEVKDLEVKINYEIYQGLPVMTKWLEVTNHGNKKVTLNEMECEVLAVNQDQVNRIHVESNYSFALANAHAEGSALMHYASNIKVYQSGESTTKWRVDPDYHTWASHNQAEDRFLSYPHHNMLVSCLPMGPNTVINKETPFKSHITFELLHDSDDAERKSLGHRRMYKKLAPQTTESLIAGGITSHDPVKLKSFIDQMSELGMERLDIQAWPGVSQDNLDSAYVKHWKDISEYARGRGIIMGGYELQVASRGRGKDVDCIDPETGKPGSVFGQSVCIASSWQDTYFKRMWEFFDRTGFKSFNMDGPYHGDPCASTVHPYHSGLEDSQWKQWSFYVEVLHELQRRNMYIPIPDWYFLNGQCATGMGYREASANLTPQQQQLLGRQYIYDGTWHKLPTMGWMTMQLVGFYTNDPRVGLEPLKDNLDRYESQLVQYLASGCQFTIRGNRIYDTPETKAMVQKWINWFKAYRDILTSEIIHVSRPTGRDLDCMMHVNPFIGHKGMVIVFNPTEDAVEKEIKLPLYYTGLKEKALISTEGVKTSYTLNNKQELLLPVKIKAGGFSWFLIE